MGLGDRIKLLRKELGLSQDAFARTLGIDRGHVSSIETGAKAPSTLLIKAICRTFFVREEWLRRGEDPMRPAPEEVLSDVIRFCRSAYGGHYTIEALRRVLASEGALDQLEGTLFRLDEAELHQMVAWLTETYRGGDTRIRNWLTVQFERAFPDFKEDLLKKQGKPGERPEAAAAGDIG